MSDVVTPAGAVRARHCSCRQKQRGGGGARTRSQSRGRHIDQSLESGSAIASQSAVYSCVQSVITSQQRGLKESCCGEGGERGGIPIRNKIEEQEEPDAEAGRNGAQDGHKQKFE
jgi:hypothetical protein